MEGLFVLGMTRTLEALNEQPVFERSPGFVMRVVVTDNVFMLLVLDEAKMRGVSGLARYRPEFSAAL